MRIEAAGSTETKDCEDLNTKIISPSLSPRPLITIFQQGLRFVND